MHKAPLRFHVLFSFSLSFLFLGLTFVHTAPAAAKPLRSRFLPMGLTALPVEETQARALFQEAIDCGLKGEVFHVQEAVSEGHVLQRGAYFLLRSSEVEGNCNSAHWTFWVFRLSCGTHSVVS